MRYSIVLLLTIFLFGTPSTALTQHYSFETYGKEVERGAAITDLSEEFGQFGENIDFNTGAVVFRKTLVNLQGNNSLRVAADYEFKLWDRLGWYPRYGWQRSTPYIVGIHSTELGWKVGNINNYSTQRCSDPSQRGVAYAVRSTKPPVDNYLAEDYWDGNSLVGVPGAGIIRPLNSGEPTLSSTSIRWATNGGWRFSCYTLPDGSEGFVGHRTNGEKYYFGIPQAGEDVLEIISNFHPDANTWLDVSLYKMHLVRVEDKFGNWVNYSTNKIESSDGRIIEFEPPLPGSNTTKVKAGGREWSISTQRGSGPMGVPFGNTVANPDGSTWSISNSGTISESSYAGSLCTSQQSIPLKYSGQLSISIKLESGATGVFIIQPRRHGYSNVNYECQSITPMGPHYSKTPHFVDLLSLVSRTVQGPGISTVQHTFSYGGFSGCYAPSFGSTPDVCNANSQGTRSFTVTASNGQVETFTFGNIVQINAGLLLNHSVGAISSTVYEYAIPFQGFGGRGKRQVYDLQETSIAVVKRRTTTVDGRTFDWVIDSNCGADGAQLCIDQHFRPTKVTVSSP